MADETQPAPEQPAPMTEEERITLSADWQAYRARYGANGAPAVLRAEEKAFVAGFLARRHREGAEIKRLQELIARNHRAYLSVQGIDPDTEQARAAVAQHVAAAFPEVRP